MTGAIRWESSDFVCQGRRVLKGDVPIIRINEFGLSRRRQIGSWTGLKRFQLSA